MYVYLVVVNTDRNPVIIAMTPLHQPLIATALEMELYDAIPMQT